MLSTQAHCHSSSLLFCTLCNSVQHHSDLLIVEQPLLQKLDKNSVAEATGVQLKCLGVLAPEQWNEQRNVQLLHKKRVGNVILSNS